MLVTQCVPILISNLGATLDVVSTRGEQVSNVQKPRDRETSDIHCTDPPEPIKSTARLCRTPAGVNTPGTSPRWTYTAAVRSAARNTCGLVRLPGTLDSMTAGTDAMRVNVCGEDAVGLHT